jgi:hypothetical protein
MCGFRRPIRSARGIRLRPSCRRERFRRFCSTRWFWSQGIRGASGRFGSRSCCHQLWRPGLRVWSRTCTQCIRGIFIHRRKRRLWFRFFSTSCFFSVPPTSGSSCVYSAQFIWGNFIQWRTIIWRIRCWGSSCFFQRRRHGWLSKSGLWCSTRFFKASWR